MMYVTYIHDIVMYSKSCVYHIYFIAVTVMYMYHIHTRMRRNTTTFS